MVMFYYLLLKPDVPASKVIVPQYNVETGEDPPPSPCLELALGEWMEQFVEQHLERQQPRPAPQDALSDDCDRNEDAAIFVPDPIADALTLWMKQPLTGKIEFIRGMDPLEKGPPMPIDQVLAEYRRECREDLAECRRAIPQTVATVFEAADRRNVARVCAEREQWLRRQERILDLASPCAAQGVIAVYSTVYDDESAEVERDDPWAGDVGMHLPSRWLHHSLDSYNLLPYVNDVLINGRSWKADPPKQAA
jgi:hypothetical protein